MNSADRKCLEGWKSLIGAPPAPWIAHGQCIYEAQQLVLNGTACFRMDGKPSMTYNPDKIIGYCDDYHSANLIALKHNASIGHWMFNDHIVWMEKQLA